MELLYIGGREYYYYDTYDTWRDAYNVGRYHHRRDRAKYYILKGKGGMFNTQFFKLYMTKIQRVL